MNTMNTWKRCAAMILAGTMTAAVMAGCGVPAPAAPAQSAAPAEAAPADAQPAAAPAETAEPGKVDLANATGRLKTILEKGVIQVTTEPYFPPNEFIDPAKEGQDQYVGSDMELAKLIAERLGVTQSGSIQEALVNMQIPKYREFKRVSSMSPDAFLSVQEGKARQARDTAG